MHIEDVSYTDTKSFNKQDTNNENNQQNDENNEQDELSNNKDPVESSYEHTQRSPPPSASIDYMKKENKKNIETSNVYIKYDKSAPGEGFCIGVTKPTINYDNNLWNDFKSYLVNQNQSHHTIRNKIQYVKRFYYVLEKEDAHELLHLSTETKQHAMKSLSSLSKYLGIYDKWQNIIKRYQLKWPKKGGYDVFQKIFDSEGQSYSSMISWIKESINKLPREYGNYILFNTMTGLRPDESYNAIKLIKNNINEYVNRERMLLLHYKFPNLFLRISKKAYISIINSNILETAKDTIELTSYDSIRKKIKEIGLDMNMYYCRKIFATFLRNNGVEQEIIDLLQGRTPSSIFVNHYYRPDINEIITKKIKPLLNSLLNEVRNNYDVKP